MDDHRYQGWLHAICRQRRELEPGSVTKGHLGMTEFLIAVGSGVAVAALCFIAYTLWQLSTKLVKLQTLMETFVKSVDMKLSDHEERIRELERP